jgi:hypothetical protein
MGPFNDLIARFDSFFNSIIHGRTKLTIQSSVTILYQCDIMVVNNNAAEVVGVDVESLGLSMGMSGIILRQSRGRRPV